MLLAVCNLIHKGLFSQQQKCELLPGVLELVEKLRVFFNPEDSWTGSEQGAVSPRIELHLKVLNHCSTDSLVASNEFLCQFLHWMTKDRLYMNLQPQQKTFRSVSILTSFKFTRKSKLGCKLIKDSMYCIANVPTDVWLRGASAHQLTYGRMTY